MSYDIELVDHVTKDVIALDAPHGMKGGTYAVGGEPMARFNITYNYAPIIGRVIDGGLRGLYGKSGGEAIPLLESAIGKLKDDVDGDYWKPTEGNVKRALCAVLALSRMRPDGIWNGD